MDGLIALVFIVVIISMFLVAFKQMPIRVGAPSKCLLVEYLGGHPDLNKGLTKVWKEENSLVIARTKRQKAMMPLETIVAVQSSNGVQWVNTGGGLSIGGAIVGGALLGPLGAIVGGTKRTKIKKFGEETTSLILHTKSGMQLSVVFKGGMKTYDSLIKIIGVTL